MADATPSSKQLPRYDTDRDGDEYATDTGPYVHYTDAQAEIERLSRQVGLLQKSRDEYYEAYWKLKNSGHETKPQVCEMRAIPQTLVDPLMLAAESILSEEHSKIIDQSWETAPFRRLRKALNKLQTYRARSETSVDEEWENAKRAMTGESSLKAEPLQGPYCPDTNQPCDRMCQSICNRRECAHEFLPTAGQALSETDPRCIKCHRRWSSVNGTVKP